MVLRSFTDFSILPHHIFGYSSLVYILMFACEFTLFAFFFFENIYFCPSLFSTLNSPTYTVSPCIKVSREFLICFLISFWNNFVCIFWGGENKIKHNRKYNSDLNNAWILWELFSVLLIDTFLDKDPFMQMLPKCGLRICLRDHEHLWPFVAVEAEKVFLTHSWEIYLCLPKSECVLF